MAPTTNEGTLERVLELISRRTDTYQTGMQTTVCWNSDAGWLNSITKLEFIRKDEKPPAELTSKYQSVQIIRRLLTPNEVSALLKQLAEKRSLEIGADIKELPHDGRFSIGSKTRHPHSEWSQWPADIFDIQSNSATGQTWPPDQALIALNAPYYPSLEYVVSDLFGIRVQGWTNYLRGQVMVVLPDFRARIAKLTVALTYVRADLECVFLKPSDLVMKTYGESRTGRLVQETTRLHESFVQFDLLDRASFVSMALMCASTGDVLDEKVFREGVSWREPNVFVEPLAPEIEQFLLTGEGETVEFKVKLAPNSQGLAKTATAFANTNGGTIVFGIDDEQRVVGCEIRGMADTITNIVRSHCDPPPSFTTKIVKYDNKELFVVRIAQSSATVHVVKELGPFIRANRSNRSPTSHELELLQKRRSSSGNSPISSWMTG
jgi:hypothetical protein